MKKLTIYLISLGLMLPQISMAGTFAGWLWADTSPKPYQPTPWEEIKAKYKPISQQQLRAILQTLQFSTDKWSRQRALSQLRFSTVDDIAVLRTLSEKVLPYETFDANKKDIMFIIEKRQPQDHVINERLAYIAADTTLDFQLRDSALDALYAIQIKNHNPISQEPEDNFNGYTIRKLVSILADPHIYLRNAAETILDKIGTAQLDPLVGTVSVMEYKLFCDKYEDTDPEACYEATPSWLSHDRQKDAQKDVAKTANKYNHISNANKDIKDLFKDRRSHYFGN